jgi:Skp family chaperone for outer membrane proteins
MFTEITKLKEINENKAVEHANQSAELESLKLESAGFNEKLGKTQEQIREKQKELDAKKATLSETELELKRVRESN